MGKAQRALKQTIFSSPQNIDGHGIAFAHHTDFSHPCALDSGQPSRCSSCRTDSDMIRVDTYPFQIWESDVQDISLPFQKTKKLKADYPFAARCRRASLGS